MEIQKAKDFIEDVMFDDCFDTQPYENDVCFILTQNEIGELHLALNEWIDNNNIVRVQGVARINYEIKKFLEETKEGDKQ